MLGEKNPTDASAGRGELYRGESGMLRLLGRLWVTEIDLPLLEILCEGELREPYLAVGGWAPELADASSVESLAVEYCGCFLGPKGHLPPYQSVVDQSRFQASAAESMESYIKVIGSPVGDYASIQMRDHAGVQLSLLQTVTAAIERADVADADRDSLQEIRDAFFEQHIAWIRNYCAVAAEKTTSRFYSALFNVTRDFLNSRLS